MLKVKKFFFISFLMIAALSAKEILIHEGLLTSVKELQPLLAITATPPQSMQEKVPSQLSDNVEWLPGYWAWIENDQDFKWVNGFWRKAPPGKFWRNGEWKQSKGYWVWLKGFWSEKPIDKVAFIENGPPDLIEEVIQKPDSKNTFWVPGHYVYKGKSYQWVKGYWEDFDLNWVLVPSHYGWRPEGYYFVEAFWDWPIEERGEVYESLEPLIAIPQEEIVQQVFYSYPDYLTFFEQYNYFHPQSLSDTPPWWSWQTWWTYNWSNQWALWWWYTHPGYVQPKWLTGEVSNHIIPPSPQLLAAIKHASAPWIITANGVISNKRTAKEAKKLESTNNAFNMMFILSSDKWHLFQKAILPRLKSNFKALKPNGKKNALLLSRQQFVPKGIGKKFSESPIKPYLKKWKSKLSNFDIAVDDSTTETQKNWEEEIRERDKRRSAAWEKRRDAFNRNSANTEQLWDESVRLRNEERGSYQDNIRRYQLEEEEKQAFWQPQIDAREAERKEEQKAYSEEQKLHLEEQEYERYKDQQLSYSRDDARRDAVRSDARRYMQKQETVKRDNLRYRQNQETIKRDNLRYSQHEEDLKNERLKNEKKQEDIKFWEELKKLEAERGDVTTNEDDKWWLKREAQKKEALERDRKLQETEDFWKKQEREKDETRQKASTGNGDIGKFGFPLPSSAD